MKRIAFAIACLVLGFAASASAQTKPTLPKVELNGPCLPIDSRPECQKDGNISVAPTGNLQKDAVALWKKIVAASDKDLTYAIAMAKSANTSTNGITSAAGMRLQCLQAIQALNQQANGQNIKDASGNVMARPDPALFTDAETLAEVIDAVQPSGPLWTSCAGAAQLAATNTLTFINALVSGAAGLAALGIK